MEGATEWACGTDPAGRGPGGPAGPHCACGPGNLAACHRGTWGAQEGDSLSPGPLGDPEFGLSPHDGTLRITGRPGCWSHLLKPRCVPAGSRGLKGTCRTEVLLGWPRPGFLLRRGHWAWIGHASNSAKATGGQETEVRPGTRPVSCCAWVLSPHLPYLIRGLAPSMRPTCPTPRVCERLPVLALHGWCHGGCSCRHRLGFLQSPWFPWAALGHLPAPTPGRGLGLSSPGHSLSLGCETPCPVSGAALFESFPGSRDQKAGPRRGDQARGPGVAQASRGETCSREGVVCALALVTALSVEMSLSHLSTASSDRFRGWVI